MALFEKIEAAARLEPVQRDAELAVLEVAEASSWNPIRRVAAPDYTKFFQRDDKRRAELKSLIAAAQ